jgi:F0F1-type ATP synthase epsilon subunit
MASMKLTLVSPSGVMASEEVSLIRAWTPGGQVELLPGHCAYLGLVCDGELEAVSASTGKILKFSIGDGSLECDNEQVTVLTDRVH